MNRRYLLILIKSLTIILLYFIWPSLTSLFLTCFQLSVNAEFWLRLFSNIIFMTLLIAFYFKPLTNDFKAYMKRFGYHTSKVIWYTFLSLIAMFMTAAIAAMITGSTTDFTGNNTTILSYFSKTPSIVVFLTIIYYPVVEEIVFKKTIKDVISNKWFFIIFSAFIFGFFHVAFLDTITIQAVISSIPYAVMGGISSYAYYKTNNIFIPIASRMLYNMIPLVFSLITIMV